MICREIGIIVNDNLYIKFGDNLNNLSNTSNHINLSNKDKKNFLKFIVL